jgi:hypothetical protein
MRLILQIAVGVFLGNVLYGIWTFFLSLAMVSALFSAFTSRGTPQPEHGGHLADDQWCSGGVVVTHGAAEHSVVIVRDLVGGPAIPCSGAYRSR